MTTVLKNLRGACLLAAAMLVPAAAFASSHREAPAISNDPCADNTDLWAWVDKGTHANLNIVASYIPFEEPSGGPNFHKFCDDVLYQLHIVRGGTTLSDAFTYTIKFTTTPPPRVDVADFTKGPGGGKEFFSQISLASQTYTVTRTDAANVSTDIAVKIPVAPVNYGPRTQSVGKSLGLFASATYDDAFISTNYLKPTTEGGMVFAGPRDDGFYADLGAIFDLANLKGKTASGTVGTAGYVPAAVDTLSHYNTHSIVLQIPTTKLTTGGTVPTAASTENTVGVWAAACRRRITILRKDGSSDGYGPWVQVSRLGLPLINEAVIGIQDKDKFNRTTPATDAANFAAYFLNPIIVRDAAVVGIYGAGAPAPDQFAKNRTDIIDLINLTDIPAKSAHAIATIGDVLRVDLGIDSQFPNGRVVGGGASANQDQVNVTHVLLSYLLLKKTSGVSDGVDSNDKPYLAAFPYLPLPWRGWDEGHGLPTTP